MTNENKTRLLDSFIKKYPFNYEQDYCTIMNKRRYMQDDNLEEASALFDEFQDYIIDYFTSEI